MSLDACWPLSSFEMGSFSYGKMPMMTYPTCDDMHFYKLNDSIQELNLNHLIQVLLLHFIFFLDRTWT
jgi:hypothetical protein